MTKLIIIFTRDQQNQSSLIKRATQMIEKLRLNQPNKRMTVNSNRYKPIKKSTIFYLLEDKSKNLKAGTAKPNE